MTLLMVDHYYLSIPETLNKLLANTGVTVDWKIFSEKLCINMANQFSTSHALFKKKTITNTIHSSQL